MKTAESYKARGFFTNGLIGSALTARG